MVEGLNLNFFDIRKELRKQKKLTKKRKPIGKDVVMRKKDITDLGRSVQAQIDASAPRPMKAEVNIISTNVRRLTD